MGEPTDHTTRWLECEDCHKQKEDTIETICPYAEDINNSQIDATLCDDCYHERCMDI